MDFIIGQVTMKWTMATISLRRENWGQENLDWEKRIDHDEIREERIERVKGQMADDDVDVLVLYDPYNIRYVTSTMWFPSFTMGRFMRYALVTQHSHPTLFENPGMETEHQLEYCPWIRDNIEPHISWEYSGPAKLPQIRRWADAFEAVLAEDGLTEGVVGVDRLAVDVIHELEDRGWTLVDGEAVISTAKQYKTEQERRLVDQAVSMADYGFHRARKAIEPGISEREVAAEINHEIRRHGAEIGDNIIVASGNHTKPYHRYVTDKKMRHGELVIIDINAPGPGGFYCDYVRNFVVGGGPNEEQKRIYAETYNQVYDALEMLEPGATTDTVAEAFPAYADDEEGSMTLAQLGHGVGVGFYEPPVITRGFSFEYPQEIREGQVLSVETYVEGEDEGARVEEQVLVTEEGVEIMSLHPHENALLEYVDNDRIYHPDNEHYWSTR